jgi:hypothetical protein
MPSSTLRVVFRPAKTAFPPGAWEREEKSCTKGCITFLTANKPTVEAIAAIAIID